MTLAIVFKGPEGVVLAADSRVTLQFQVAGTNAVMSAHYDNATKLLKVQGQEHVAAVTYGLGVLGAIEPRTAHSFLPEFEAALNASKRGRLSVKDFADQLSAFFMSQHAASQTPANAGDMFFLVGGYNEGEPYGRVFEVAVPSAPAPVEHNTGIFGIRWGGQSEITARVLNSLDGGMIQSLKTRFNLDDVQTRQLVDEMQAEHALRIPFQFLPLQDCVDLSILLIETTAQLMQYIVGVRGVGGAIDVATITRTDGYRPVQVKSVKGKRYEA